MASDATTAWAAVLVAIAVAAPAAYLTIGLGSIGSPASTGTAGASPTLPVEAPTAGTPCLDAIEEPGFASDADVETWSGEVPQATDRARIDIQSLRGGIYATTWDRDEYRVEVAEVDPQDRLQATVDAETSDGTFVLEVRVEDTFEPPGPADVDVTTGRTFAEVKVRVPDLHIVNLTQRDRPEDPDDDDLQVHTGRVGTNGTRDGFHRVLDHDLSGDALDVHVDNLDVELARTGFETLRTETDNGDVHVDAAETTRFDVRTDNGDVCASDVDAEHVKGRTDNGRIRLDGVQADDVSLETDNGDVVTRNLAAADLGAGTDNGRLDLALRPTDDGRVDLEADNGDVSLQFPQADRHGYDVTAATDNGRVTVDLAGATASSRGEAVHVRTPGWDRAEIQTTVEATTDNGDIVVEGSTS